MLSNDQNSSTLTPSHGCLCSILSSSAVSIFSEHLKQTFSPCFCSRWKSTILRRRLPAVPWGMPKKALLRAPLLETDFVMFNEGQQPWRVYVLRLHFDFIARTRFELVF